MTAVSARHCVVDTTAQLCVDTVLLCEGYLLPKPVFSVIEQLKAKTVSKFVQNSRFEPTLFTVLCAQLSANTVFVFAPCVYFAARGFLPAAKYAFS